CCKEAAGNIFLNAESLLPDNYVAVHLADGSVIESGVFFGDSNIEFVRTLVIDIDEINIESLILQDGECGECRCLDREIVLVDLQEGSCFTYQHGERKGPVRSFNEYLMSRWRGPDEKVATLKVTETLNNWKDYWGNREYLLGLIK
ncbi:MAG: hypothetical protein QXU18_15255, partial [Thermoplasmatales archaeon]